MRTPRSLGQLLLLAILAVPLGLAQNAPAYRFAAAPAASPQSAPLSALAAQCAAAPALAGTMPIIQGNGSVPAPRGAQPAYSQVVLNLGNYAVGGLLTVQIIVGNGASGASVEIFPGNTAFPANGGPTAQPLAAQADISAGGCATLNLNFAQAGSFILAATGASGSNTFQYSVYVQPSFVGVFSAPAKQTTVPRAAQSSQGASIFAGVFQATSPTNSSTQPADNPNGTNPSLTAAGSASGEATIIPSSTVDLNPTTFTSGSLTTASAATSSPQPTSTPTPAPVPTPAPPPPPTPAPAPTQSPTPAPTPATPTPTPNPPSTTKLQIPARIVSISVKGSPGVPDLGGHCIICELWHPTAVEPKLMMCVSPVLGSSSTGGEACTGTCPNGHDCDARVVSGSVELSGTRPSVNVNVYDTGTGTKKLLISAKEDDATKCKETQPCMEPYTPEGAPGSVNMSVSFGFGPLHCDSPTSQPFSKADSNPPSNWPPPATNKDYILGHRQAELPPGPVPVFVGDNPAANYNNPWIEEFVLTQPTSTTVQAAGTLATTRTGGYVVQLTNESTTGRKTQWFWEVFQVGPGVNFSQEDVWSANTMGSGCPGTMGVVAIATYYDGMTEDWVKNHFNRGGANDPIGLDSWWSDDPGFADQLASTLYQPTNAVTRHWILNYNYGKVVPPQ